MAEATTISPPGTKAASGLRLEIGNLSVMRAGIPVLQNIDLTLHAGDVVILRGANGAGKTTLLRAIARLLPISSGSVCWRNDPAANASSAHKNQAVFLGHDNAVKGALRVRENLAFWARRYRSNAENITPAAEKLALGRLLDRPASQLSAGQRRRLGFCRVLLAQKTLWLLDEPTAAMDADAVRMTLDLVTEHAAGGGIALIATHDPVEIGRARAVWLAAPAQAGVA